MKIKTATKKATVSDLVDQTNQHEAMIQKMVNDKKANKQKQEKALKEYKTKKVHGFWGMDSSTNESKIQFEAFLYFLGMNAEDTGKLESPAIKKHTIYCMFDKPNTYHTTKGNFEKVGGNVLLKLTKQGMKFFNTRTATHNEVDGIEHRDNLIKYFRLGKWNKGMDKTQAMYKGYQAKTWNISVK